MFKFIDNARNFKYSSINLIFEKIQVNIGAISKPNSLLIIEYVLHRVAVKILITKLIKMRVISITSVFIDKSSTCCNYIHV